MTAPLAADGQSTEVVAALDAAALPAELDELVEAARAEQRTLSLDEVIEVIKDLDPTPDVIVAVRSVVASRGVTLEEHLDDVSDAAPANGAIAATGNGTRASVLSPARLARPRPRPPSLSARRHGAPEAATTTGPGSPAPTTPCGCI
jgi:hypothetical protein